MTVSEHLVSPARPGDDRASAPPPSPTGKGAGQPPVRTRGSSYPRHRYDLAEIQHDALLELVIDVRLTLTAAGVTDHVERPVSWAMEELGNWRIGCLIRWDGRPDHHIRRPRLSTLRRIEQAAGLPVGTAERWASDWPDAVAEEATR